jgi:hypothetical protein
MAAAFAAVAVLGLRMLDVDLPIPLAYGGCLALLILRRVVAIVAAPPQPRGRAARAAATFGAIAESEAELDGLRAAVNRWETRLSWSESDRERFRTSVRPLIAELAAERLRQRHGVIMATDPQRARALLGDPLWTFLTTPSKRPPAQRDLAASISHLEKL